MIVGSFWFYLGIFCAGVLGALLAYRDHHNKINIEEKIYSQLEEEREVLSEIQKSAKLRMSKRAEDMKRVFSDYVTPSEYSSPPTKFENHKSIFIRKLPVLCAFITGFIIGFFYNYN